MDGDQVIDFAQRVKKFYYYRSLLCEQLIQGQVVIGANTSQRSPLEFNPFRNLYVEAYVVGCAALDGLSSIWHALSTLTAVKISNKQRFVSFLLEVNGANYLDRVSTPFLNYFLQKQGIEEPFRKEIENTWINNKDDIFGQNESHRVYDDPTIEQLKTLYKECHKKTIFHLKKWSRI